MSATLGELALEFGCELQGDPATVVTRVATLSNADSDSLSFLANPQYVKHLASASAACVVLREEHAASCPVAALIHADPYRIYAGIAAILHPERAVNPSVHPSASIAHDATIDAGAEIGPNVVIDNGASIGRGAVIGANSSIGRNVVIGADTRLFPNVSIYPSVRIGERCRIQSGAVIGSDGFGFAPGKDGWRRVPQVGSVVIGDDVDVGAASTIDRGAIDDTVIGNGVRIDNLVQIAHNVKIGDHSALAAQTGIAGSTTIGRHCLFAGQSGSVGHVSICDGVVVSGQTMVTKSISEPGQYGAGIPAMEMSLYRRVIARFRQLDKIATRIATLEKKTDDRRR